MELFSSRLVADKMNYYRDFIKTVRRYCIEIAFPIKIISRDLRYSCHPGITSVYTLARIYPYIDVPDFHLQPPRIRVPYVTSRPNQELRIHISTVSCGERCGVSSTCGMSKENYLFVGFT